MIENYEAMNDEELTRNTNNLLVELKNIKQELKVQDRDEFISRILAAIGANGPKITETVYTLFNSAGLMNNRRTLYNNYGNNYGEPLLGGKTKRRKKKNKRSKRKSRNNTKTRNKRKQTKKSGKKRK